MAMGLATSLLAADRVSGAISAVVESNPHVVPDVKTAFQKLSHHGEALGFRMGAGARSAAWDGNLANAEGVNGRETHYQGITRSRGPGVPYFYVTRSGIAEGDAGNMMVVRLGTRPTDGERLRSNRLLQDAKINETIPAASDAVVANIVFNYHHAGSITRVGDILAVALENPILSGLPSGRIVFLDASNPGRPVSLPYTLDIHDHDAGVVGMTKLTDGHFLLVISWGKNEKLEFYRSTGTSFRDAGFGFELHDTWNSDELSAWPAGSGACYQDLSLVTQSDGRVFMIGSRRDSTAAPLFGKDLMALYEITGWQADAPSKKVSLSLTVAETQKWTDTPGVVGNPVRIATSTINADFLAGAGAYVSPTGQLYFYATEHWNDGPGGSVRCVEFRHETVASAGSPLYSNRANLKTATFVLGEGDSITLDASQASRGIKPWVEVYEQDDYTGRSVVMDYADRGEEDYQDFRKFGDGFNDEASAVRWYTPIGWSIMLHNEDNFGLDESILLLPGSGVPSSMSLKDASFNNRVTSMRFIPPAVNNLDQAATVTWNADDSNPALASLGARQTKTAILTAGWESGTFPVSITVGPAPTTTESYTFTITNKPPRIVTAKPTPLADVSGEVQLQVSYIDDGIGDTHSAEIHWGDGTVDRIDSLPSFANDFTRSHVYRETDPCEPDTSTFQIHVTLTDNDGDTAQIEKTHTIAWPRPTVRTNGPGNSLVFADGSGLATIQHHSSLNPFPFTVMTWVRTEQTNSTALVSKYLSNFGGYQIHLIQGQVHAWHFHDLQGWVAGPGEGFAANGVDFNGRGLNGGFVADGAWHHIAWVVDETGGSLYVDGVNRNRGSWVGSPGASQMSDHLRFGVWPGSRGPSDRSRFIGELDEVSLWNRVLAADEIDYHRYHPLSSFEPGLIAVFKMDEAEVGNLLGFREGTASYTGTVTTGIAWSTSTVGRATSPAPLNQSIRFNGREGVVIAEQDSLMPYPMTLSAWIKTESTNRALLIHNYSESSDMGYRLSIDRGRLKAEYARSKTDYIRDGLQPLDGGVVADGIWHHVVFTVSDDGGKLYLDGDLKIHGFWKGVPGGAKSQRDLIWGRSRDASSAGWQPFAGALDEVTLWNLEKTVQEARELADGPLTGSEAGLIGYWPMEQSEDPRLEGKVRDLAIAGGVNDGKADSTVEWQSSEVWSARRTRGPGWGLLFDGVTGTVAVGPKNPMNAYPLSVLAWVKTTQTNEAALINNYEAGSANGWQVFISEGRLRAWYFKDSRNLVFAGNNGLDGGWIADCQWHQVGFVVDAEGGRLYVDGVLRASQSWVGTPGPSSSREPLRLGNYPGNTLPSGAHYYGLMDEISIWNVGLTPEQVNSFGWSQPQRDTPGMLTYWRCNEGQGTSLLPFNHAKSAVSATLNEGVSWVRSDAIVGPPAMVPRIGQTEWTPATGTHIRFSGQSRYRYHVERTASLENPTWQTLGLATETAPGSFELIDPNSTAGGKGFYRLLTQ